jgi:hypothetical protein
MKVNVYVFRNIITILKRILVENEPLKLHDRC